LTTCHFKAGMLGSIHDRVTLLLFSQFFITTARPHQISWQVLSTHSIVSSSRTVRPCSPWGVHPWECF